MSDPVVESRRFRTWDHTEAPSERRRWMLVAQAQFTRYRRAWHFWVIVGLTVVLSVFTLIGTFIAMDEGHGGINDEPIVYALIPTLGVIVGAALLLLCAPSIADDVRYNAPLFYFSRPMNVRDYAIGKSAFALAIMLMLSLPPVLVMGVASIGTWGADGPPPPEMPEPGSSQFAFDNYERRLAEYPQRLEVWEQSHMNHFGDWLYTISMLLAGVTAAAVFLAALTTYLSSLTQRGWHASMALVVTLAAALAIGIPLGVVLLGDEGTLAGLFSLTMWPVIVTMLPLVAYYQVYDDPWLGDAPATIILTYIAMAGTTALLYLLTYRRLRKLEGAA